MSDINNIDGWKPLILVVEDEKELARLNARLLKRRGYDTLVACTAAEARTLFQTHKPDLFVLDIELPDGDGRMLCREFRQKTDAPVLFLTGRSKKEDKIEGLNTGGDYYLTKPYDIDEFVAVVQSLIRRIGSMRKKIDEVSAITITKGSLALDLHERKAYINGNDAQLTQKEFAVLLMLVENENKELTNEQIYENIWGASMNNDANAVRLQISRLKKKLDEINAEDFAIFTEYGKGYTFITYR